MPDLRNDTLRAILEKVNYDNTAPIINVGYDRHQEINSLLCKSDLAKLSATCTTLFVSCLGNLRKEKTIMKTFINLVENADYANVEELIQANPALIFTKIEDPTDPQQLTTPLKLAFKNFDTYMWTLFLNRIDGNQQYIGEFNKQKAQQTEHYDFASLEAAYLNLVKSIQKIDYNDNIEKFFPEIHSAMLRVGLEQKTLPKHLLKTLCSDPLFRHARDQSTKYYFDPERKPKSCFVYNSSLFDPVVDLLATEHFASLGTYSIRLS